MEKIPFWGVKSFIFYPREQPCLLACRVWVSSLLVPLVLKEPAPTGSHRGLTRHWLSWEDWSWSKAPSPGILWMDLGLGAAGKGQGHTTICHCAETRSRWGRQMWPLIPSPGLWGPGHGMGTQLQVLSPNEPPSPSALQLPHASVFLLGPGSSRAHRVTEELRQHQAGLCSPLSSSSAGVGARSPWCSAG